jgi:Tfp pilus assembly protein PilF
MKMKIFFVVTLLLFSNSAIAEDCPLAAKKIKEGLSLGVSITSVSTETPQKISAILETQRNLFEEAIKLCDHFADAHYNLAVIYLRDGQPEKSISELNKAIDLAEESAYFIARGSAEFALKNYSVAENDYQKALTIDPRNSEALVGLGSVAEINGDPSTAEEKFREAIKLDPLNQDAFYNLGLVLFKNGDFDQAEASFQSALSGDSGFLPARLALAELYIKKKDYAQAERTLKATTLINPHQARSWILLSKVYKKQDMIAEMLEVLAEGEKQTSGDKELVALFGFLAYQNGQKEMGISKLQELEKREPNFVQAKDYLSWIYLEEGKYSEAETEILSGLRLDQGNPRLHNNYGALLEKQKNFSKAADQYQKALELDPEMKEAKLNLTRIKEKL